MSDIHGLIRRRIWKRKIKEKIRTKKEMTIAKASRVAKRRGFDGEEQAGGLGEGPSGTFLASMGIGGEGL